MNAAGTEFMSLPPLSTNANETTIAEKVRFNLILEPGMRFGNDVHAVQRLSKSKTV
jgi:hypothetical protein